jgi:hypothetical protein
MTLSFAFGTMLNPIARVRLMKGSRRERRVDKKYEQLASRLDSKHRTQMQF